MTFHLDLRIWARGVRVGENMRWGYRGISRPTWKDLGLQHYRRHNPKSHPLVHSLISCERYTEKLWNAEAAIYLESDWDAEWREYCEGVCHSARYCPHENEDDYKAAVEEMFEDTDARYKWSNEQQEWDWVLENIQNIVDCDEAVMDFLKDHPVTEVYSNSREEWFELDEVIGYCFECDEPCLENDIFKLPEEDEAQVACHDFDPNCEQCPYPGNGHVECLFETEMKRRLLICCHYCAEVFAADNLENNRLRPFLWPPHVPYPPRRGFAGEFLDVPQPTER